MSYEPEKTRKDLLLAGALPSLPASAIEKAPIAGIDPLRLSFPQMHRPQPPSAAPIDFWSNQAASQQQMPRNLSDVGAASPLRADLSGTLGPGRIALMHPPPTGPRGRATIPASTRRPGRARSAAMRDRPIAGRGR